MPNITGIYYFNTGIQKGNNLKNNFISLLYSSLNCNIFLAKEHNNKNFKPLIYQPNNGVIIIGHINSFDKKSKLYSNQIAKAKKLIINSNGKWLADNIWGDYVIILIEEENNSLSIYRDPIGYATIYYLVTDQYIIFSTKLELFAIYNENILLKDIGYLTSFIVYGSQTTSQTPFLNIKELEPGNMLKITKTKIKKEIFWDPIDHVSNQYTRSFTLHHKLKETIIKYVNESKGIYLELSGGLDSSTLLSVLCDISKYTKQKIIASTVYYPSIAAANELIYAREIAKSFEVTLVEVNGENYLPFTNLLKNELLYNWDKPSAQLLQLSLHKYHTELAKHFNCENVFNGFGGDQLFQAKYDNPIYLCDYLLNCNFKHLLVEATSISYNDGVPLILIFWQTIKNLYFHFANKYEHYKWTNEYADWYTRELIELANKKIPKPPFAKGLRKIMPSKVLHILDIYDSFAQTDRMYRDKITPLYHPFLSQPIVEYVLTIPTEQLYTANMDRKVIRSEMRNIIPRSIIKRFSKGEYTGIYQMGIKNNYNEVQELLLGGWLAKNKLINKEKLKIDLYKTSQGFSTNIWPILNAAALEIWLLAWRFRG